MCRGSACKASPSSSGGASYRYWACCCEEVGRPQSLLVQDARMCPASGHATARQLCGALEDGRCQVGIRLGASGVVSKCAHVVLGNERQAAHPACGNEKRGARWRRGTRGAEVGAVSMSGGERVGAGGQPEQCIAVLSSPSRWPAGLGWRRPKVLTVRGVWRVARGEASGVRRRHRLRPRQTRAPGAAWQPGRRSSGAVGQRGAAGRRQHPGATDSAGPVRCARAAAPG